MVSEAVSIRRQVIVGWTLRFSNVGVLVLLIVLFTAFAPGFMSALSLTNILASTSVFLLLALGETFVMIAGGIDISVGSMLGLGGVAGAAYMSGNYHWWPWRSPPYLGTLIALAVGLAGGLLNGALIAYLKLNALIVTLATYGAFLGFADLLSNGLPIVNLPPASFDVGTGEVWNIPYIVFLPRASPRAYLDLQEYPIWPLYLRDWSKSRGCTPGGREYRGPHLDALWAVRAPGRPRWHDQCRPLLNGIEHFRRRMICWSQLRLSLSAARR